MICPWRQTPATPPLSTGLGRNAPRQNSGTASFLSLVFAPWVLVGWGTRGWWLVKRLRNTLTGSHLAHESTTSSFWDFGIDSLCLGFFGDFLGILDLQLSSLLSFGFSLSLSWFLSNSTSFASSYTPHVLSIRVSSSFLSSVRQGFVGGHTGMDGKGCSFSGSLACLAYSIMMTGYEINARDFALHPFQSLVQSLSGS